MHKNMVFLVFWCCIQTAIGQDQKIIKTYVDEVFNLEYKSAYAFASNFDDPQLVQEFQSLANTLYYAGQEEIYTPYTTTLEASESVVYCIAMLHKGFDELYHNPNRVDSYKYFFKAYNTSKQVQNESLQKLCLYGMLEFFHFQYSLTQDQFEPYLNEFGKLADTTIETCWYLWYCTYFKLENVFPKERRVHVLINDLEKATNLLKKGHNFYVIFYSIKASYLENEKLIAKAKPYHLKVLKETKQVPTNKYLFFRTYIHLVSISHNEKKFAEGLKYLETAKEYIDISDSIKSWMHIRNYGSKLYEGLGDAEKAYRDLLAANDLKNKSGVSEVSLTNFQLRSEIEEEQRKLVISDQKTKQQSLAIIILIVMLSLGGIIVFLYYRNTKRKQRIIAQQLEIEGQKLEKVQKEQELAAIDAMILGQEKEREAIASDLHDNVCALLSAAKMQFEHLTERLESEDKKKVEELFVKTKNLLDNAYDEVYSMAYQKNSGIMAKKALLPAIENLIKNNNGINGIQIELQHFGLDQRLEASKEIFIFRIIQELMANIIKHAKAKAANVSITVHKTTISIIVEDNGIGISEEVFLKDKGLGIRNIKKRIESIHGTMNFDSYKNKGTSIIIEIPR
ncbi:sensor histidine kinase [Kordia jejudonensis]|uniref:sensor histidine kinase n=1 Tax=Kordia jejudonensis TaxID=1348245 RepID=UPI0006297A46|nr:sensor histidine kinase [Kordia jejudonensis]